MSINRSSSVPPQKFNTPPPSMQDETERCKSLPTLKDQAKENDNESSDPDPENEETVEERMIEYDKDDSTTRLLDEDKRKYSKPNISEKEQEKSTKTKKLSATIYNFWDHVKGRKRSKSRAKELSEEQRMRYKLEYHFMTPFQKYKKGRRPWKLGIQILKIIIVTIQVRKVHKFGR